MKLIACAFVCLLLIAFQVSAQVLVLYARADAAPHAEAVRQVASVCSAAVSDRFIPPGALWRDRLADTIQQTGAVFVLWSPAAARSVELGAEWRMAVAQDKRVIPVVLPGAPPLPPELAARQWIELPRTR